MSERLTTRVAVSAVLIVFAFLWSSTGTLGQGGGGRVVAPAPRDATQQAAVGTGAIAGTVVLEGTGAPVRRARVNLAAPELRGGRSASTDDQGRFSFQGLPAGRYTLSVSKPGFVGVAYGAKRAGRPGTAIQLSDGQRIERLSVAMPRGSVITGIVLDEHGEPAAGTQVRALRYVLRTGERTLEQAGQDQTDDRGMYRIYQLQPGEYIVNAVARNTPGADMRQLMAAELSSLAQAQAVVADGRGPGFVSFDTLGTPAVLEARMTQLQQQLSSLESQSTAYAPVYYPGTPALTSATPIRLNVAEERGGVDFRLQLVPTTRVKGIVTSAAGTLPPGTQVALVPGRQGGGGTVPGIGSSTTRVGPDGRFTFENVTPGDYLLQARNTIREAPFTVAAQGPGGRGGRGGPGNITQVMWAAAEVVVGGQPLPDFILNLQGGMTVSGRVEVQGAGQAGFDPSSVRVMLASRGPQMFEMGALAPAQVDASGRFVIPGVAPGRYTLAATMAAGGRGGRGGRGLPQLATSGAVTTSQLSLVSAVVNGRDLLDFPIEIGPNQNVSNVVVTFSDRTQELSGTIQDTSGRPTSDFTIIVFPSDSRYWMPQARRIGSTRPGTDGRFSFRGLPPGDYRLTAVTDVEPGEWYDPAFLSQMGSASIPIALSEGEKKVQDIRLAP
jgi:uncharacterized protein (DUF2141 family)